MTKSVTSGTVRGVVLAVTTMSSFMTPFMISSMNIALPTIANEFSLDAVTLNWIATAYLLAAAVFLVPMGRVGDIYGRKKVFTIGLVVYAVASLLGAIANSAATIIALRALQGLGGAMIFGTGVAILTSVFPPNERGKVLGINVAAVYTGLSLGPVIGGVMTERFGWRSIFIASFVIALATIIGVLWKLRDEWAEARGEKLDVTGSVIYGVALVTMMFGLSRLPDMLGAWLTAAGLAGLVVFVRWEMKVANPVLSIGLFRNNLAFTLSNVAALVNYSATYAVTFLLSLYLQYIKGFNPESAGLVIVSMPAMQAVLSPFTGRLSDRIEPRILASIGMGLTCAGLLLFAFLDESTNIAVIIAGLIILGLGFGFFSSPNTNAVMGAVDKKFYGVGSGVLSTMRLIGQMLSMAIALLLFALFLGRAQITPQYYPAFLASLRMAFTIFTVLCLGGIFASLARGRVHPS